MNTPDLTPAEWGVVLSELRDRLSLYGSQEKSSARIGSRYGESRAKLAQNRVNPIVDKIAAALLGGGE